jgi:hypothetical protein
MIAFCREGRRETGAAQGVGGWTATSKRPERSDSSAHRSSNGISAISRCPQNIADDGHVTGVEG